MSRPRVTSGPIDDIAATLADLQARLRNLETVGHRHDDQYPYLPQFSPRATFSTDQTIANNTSTVLIWDAVDDNTWGAFDPSFPDILTVPTDGVYWMLAGIRWASNATGFRLLQIEAVASLDVFGTVSQDGVTGLTTRQVAVSAPYFLSAGDRIRVRVWQASGGPLDILAQSGNGIDPSFAMIRLA